MEYYHDYEYLKLVQDILNNGARKENRTGVDTFAVFSRQMRFKLYDESIPLLTTKKMHTRSIIYEILWYLQGNTSSEELERNGVDIWKEWKDEKGELGKIYGYQWRNWESKPNKIVYVDPRLVNKNDLDSPPPIFKRLTPNVDRDDSFIGTKHETKECGHLIVIDLDNIDSKGDHEYTIQFEKTGYIKNNVRKSIIRRGHIIDIYLPRVYGVGYLGEYDKKDPNLKQIQRHWYKILERCYDNTVPEYQLYGGNGIFVHPEWHCFANFQHDVKHIPNWDNKRRDPTLYHLDKDYYQSNCYSKNTCTWLSIKHNTLYRKNPSPFKAITPDNNEITYLSVHEVCEDFDLTKQLVYKVLNKKLDKHKGFKFEKIDVPERKLARYALPVDQVAEVIDKLRTKPNDRRLIVSAWNVGELDVMALPPCHYAFQFYTRPLGRQERLIEHGEGRFDATHTELDRWGVPKYALSCMLNQRSCDTGLGVPFNIVQYSILTHMIAHVCNMVPEEFIWNGGDVHIYENHIDQLKEQLTRDPYPSPRLILNKDVKEINDFKYEDFKIVGYKHHPLIRMEVSV